MRMTTVLFSVVLGVFALPASSQSRSTARSVIQVGITSPTGATTCGYVVTATVLDLVDTVGTETTSPTYRVIEVQESGLILTQKGAAYDRALSIANAGIRSGDWFYPAHTIRRVTVNQFCQ